MSASRKLGRPITEWSDTVDGSLEFEAVVVGSGYGASVMAARLAPVFSAGQLVVLERGLEQAAEDFPQTPRDLLLQLRSRQRPHGLFDFIATPDLDVLRGNGLGGTSLINAAVMLEAGPLERIQNGWPAELHQNALAPYYSRARETLGVQKYADQTDPDDHPLRTDARGRPQKFRAPLPKTESLRAAALAEGIDQMAEKVPLAVRFFADGPEHDALGRERGLCVLCGDCVTGCRFDAKNSVDRNYLPLAVQGGARVLTAVQVSSIEALNDGSRFRYLIHAESFRRGFWGYRRRHVQIRARNVFLGAGATGSTEILLRSQKRHGLSVSPTLGTFFSGNADSFSLALDPHPSPSDAAGPTTPGSTIMSMIDLRPTKGYIIQDGSIPSALYSILKLAVGAFNRTTSLVWLGMGYDASLGQIKLDAKDRVSLSWPNSGSGASLVEQGTLFKKLSHILRFKHVESPRVAAKILGLNSGVPVTVHPLGGVPMGARATEGCVDSAGRLWTAEGQYWAGFYVMDGSVCRGSVGSNPALTITALAEFAAEKIQREDLAVLK